MSESKHLFEAGLVADAGYPASDGQGARVLPILWKRRNALLTAAAAGLLLSGSYLIFAGTLYRGTARFSITRSAPAGTENRASNSESAADETLNQRERLKSQAVLAVALSRPETADLQTWNGVGKRLSYVRNHLSVSSDRANVMTVSVETPYPDDSDRLANAIVRSFAEYQTQPKYSSVAAALEELSAQTRKSQQGLTDISGLMRAIELKYGALTGNEQTSAALAELPAITQQLGTARLETLKARSDYEEAAKSTTATAGAATTMPSGALIASASVPHQESEIRQELTDAQARLLELRQHYLPGHPSIAAQQRRVELLSRAYSGALQERWEAARRRQSALQDVFDRQQRLAVEVSAAAAEYSRLKFDAERLRRQLDSLDARASAIQLARDATAVTVDFFDPADGAVKSAPQTDSVLLAGLLLGLLAGSGYSLVQERTNGRLRSSETARRALGLPVLGAIPSLPAGMSTVLAAQRITSDPGSDVAEAYRAVRAALQSSSPAERSRTLLVTSAGEAEGKTTSAANLAIAVAQTGSRVLLVDASLRKPTLHNIFGIRQSVGFAALLAGRGNLDRAIQTTTTRQLSLLACGSAPSNPTELLNSPALAELLETLADRFDMVIIDGPAMSKSPDGRILAAHTDLTMLVVRADATSRRQALVARDQLIGIGANIVGVVVTMAAGNTEPPVKTAGRPVDEMIDEPEVEPSV